MVDSPTLSSDTADVLQAGILAPIVDTGLVAGAVRAEDALGVAAGHVGRVAQQPGQAAAHRSTVHVLAGRVGPADVREARAVRHFWFCNSCGDISFIVTWLGENSVGCIVCRITGRFAMRIYC